MLLSLAIIFLVGLSAAALFERIGLPRIIGMLAIGILVSPYVLDLLDPKILGISSELRQIALIIILIKAGLTESEMQDILARCEQYGYKNKTEYIRDCVRARVDLTPDRTEIAETNRLMKRIGANINQILFAFVFLSISLTSAYAPYTNSILDIRSLLTA